MAALPEDTTGVLMALCTGRCVSVRLFASVSRVSDYVWWFILSLLVSLFLVSGVSVFLCVDELRSDIPVHRRRS